MTFYPMSGRAGTVRQPGFTESAEHGSGAGPAFQPREEGPAVTSGWPLQSYLELAALPSAVPCARLHTRQVLWEWGKLRAAAETVELLVSELVTNGLRASADLADGGSGASPDGMPTVRLWLMADRQGVLIQV